MRILCRMMLVAVLLALNVFSASIVFDVAVAGTTGSGETVYRYTYSPTGLPVQKNTEIDIRFDPTLYTMLMNPVAPADYDLVVLQPDNPPGAFGDYSALAKVANPTQSGPFSVDFIFLGSGKPGPQPFFINQFNANGGFTTVASGTTVSVIPEPGTFLLGCTALLTILGARRAGSKSRGTAA